MHQLVETVFELMNYKSGADHRLKISCEVVLNQVTTRMKQLKSNGDIKALGEEFHQWFIDDIDIDNVECCTYWEQWFDD